VIATGVTTTVREFVVKAFDEVGIQIAFRGSGLDEVGYVVACDYEEFQVPVGKEVIRIDPMYYRPTEVDLLLGDNTKARTKLHWQPRHDVADLIKEMVWSDVKLRRKEQMLMNQGFQVQKEIDI
jgi:GDPmannose 4,6-dehydratase